MSADAHLIACPHCAAMNRVPPARLAEAPNCGRCHHPLFTGLPLALGEADFDRHALRSTLPLLVDFGRPGAAPACRWPRISSRRRACLNRRSAWPRSTRKRARGWATASASAVSRRWCCCRVGVRSPGRVAQWRPKPSSGGREPRWVEWAIHDAGSVAFHRGIAVEMHEFHGRRRQWSADADDVPFSVAATGASGRRFLRVHLHG